VVHNQTLDALGYLSGPPPIQREIFVCKLLKLTFDWTVDMLNVGFGRSASA
jgi:hypothetical protein